MKDIMLSLRSEVDFYIQKLINYVLRSVFLQGFYLNNMVLIEVLLQSK